MPPEVDPDGVELVVTGGVGALLDEMNVSSQACCSGENNAAGGELGGLAMSDSLGLKRTTC